MYPLIMSKEEVVCYYRCRTTYSTTLPFFTMAFITTKFQLRTSSNHQIKRPLPNNFRHNTQLTHNVELLTIIYKYVYKHISHHITTKLLQYYYGCLIFLLLINSREIRTPFSGIVLLASHNMSTGLNQTHELARLPTGMSMSCTTKCFLSLLNTLN